MKKITTFLALLFFVFLISGCAQAPGLSPKISDSPTNYQALGECFNNEYRAEFETLYSQEKKEDVIIGIRLSDTSQEKLEKKIVKDLDRTALSGIADLKCLTRLYLNGVQVGNSRDMDISPLASLINLEYLNLEHTQINDIMPLAGLKNLNWLNLKYDQSVKNYTPLKNLTKLKYLSLSPQKGYDLSPLAGLINLEELNLYGQYQKDVDQYIKIFKQMSGLKKVNLGLIGNDREKFKAALPGIELYYKN